MKTRVDIPITTEGQAIGFLAELAYNYELWNPDDPIWSVEFGGRHKPPVDWLDKANERMDEVLELIGDKAGTQYQIIMKLQKMFPQKREQSIKMSATTALWNIYEAIEFLHYLPVRKGKKEKWLYRYHYPFQKAIGPMRKKIGTWVESVERQMYQDED